MSRSNERAVLDCDAARPLLDAYLLGELSDGDDRRLANHVRTCAACAAELGGVTRVIGLLTTLPTPDPAADLDERIILAALADRRRRHDQRSWLADLPALVFRGAMRTTGTLVVTIVAVALLGSVFVFAASGFIAQTAQLFPPSGTVRPEVTPTLAPTPELTHAATASPQGATPTPVVIVVTPAPTEQPTEVPSVEPSVEPTTSASPSPTPVATPEPTPEPTPSASVTPSASATPEPTPTPTPTATPIPTEKPRRTPPPTPTPSPSASSESSAEATNLP